MLIVCPSALALATIDGIDASLKGVLDARSYSHCGFVSMFSRIFILLSSSDARAACHKPA